MTAAMEMESYSQFGEDLLVWEYFGRRPAGFFIEAGANAPFQFSQTWFLEKQGWTGMLIEPLSDKAALLRSKRPRCQVFQNALGAPADCGEMAIGVPEDDMFAAIRPREKAPASMRTEMVQVKTLDSVIEEAGNPVIDYLSIDVEGMEWEVLQGFSLAHHHPALILVEEHFKSLRVHRHLTQRGYRLVKRTGCNNWYVPLHAPFHLTTPIERLQLWKRVHLNTPINLTRMWLKAKFRSRP
jgi:FkbM family methyltransferase